jgi:nitrous oxide reductase accessory protein NosL
MKLRYMTAALIVGLALAGCDRVDQQPEPDRAPVGQSDCDWGDLHEKSPDPDCNGLWLGTPTAGPRKPSARPVPTPVKPKTATTRRR